MEQSPIRKSSATVADVAKAAGVSKATAARVLGGYGTVSDKARTLVLETAATLDYRPNELARSMTTGRSGTIGVVVGDIENPFFSSAVRGIADVARMAGYTVILTNSGEDVAAEKAAVTALLAKRVDGLIISAASTLDFEHLREIQQSGCPLVLLDRALPALDVDTVTTDDREAAQQATEILIRNGHREIAYITACDTADHRMKSLDDLHTASVRHRVEGFIAVCTAAGLPASFDAVRLGANGREKCEALALDLLQSVHRPSAIIASDSLIALEVFKVARHLGLSIPQDLSLIAFHDADWTAVTSPPITVIRQPVYHMGKAVAAHLMERIKGANHPARHVILTTELIERSSIASRLT
ncbi:LacI family DNA-binding transcriptional regulator [Agrobacterium vitis]|uniref:LacI family DNA-binding transcriptional regulator n=1 Tax=Agrobacterium vitis TaxID=373 RepID=UPI0015D99420|nr:LacI family DNA-binding transcriptional regulator [Agrobacterium vitis]MCF1452807.1 LacI family transcriptional regulator [Agrobacterium vitis]BCH56551.1 LacI family transcriptional regulator [Agrobacterium vitis]